MTVRVQNCARTMSRHAAHVFTTELALEASWVDVGFDGELAQRGGVYFFVPAVHASMMPSWCCRASGHSKPFRLSPGAMANKPPRLGAKPAKRVELKTKADVIALVRPQLLDEYRTVFGCEWPQTPWGARWPAVLHEAHEADKEYDAGLRVLSAVHSSLKAAVKHLEGRARHPENPWDLAASAGLTYPDAFLAQLFAKDGGPLSAAFGAVEAAVRLSESSASDKARIFGQYLAERIADMAKADVAATTVDARLRESLRQGASRRIVLRTFQGKDGSTEVELAPAMFGPPPRTLTDKKDKDEWRRATVAELLDINAMSSERAGSRRRRLRDADIAIVSLLAGRLDNLQKSDWKIGYAGIRDAERRAVQKARSRRGPSPAMKDIGPAVDALLRADKKKFQTS